MSGYGWLTQSALMPKKSKPIKAEDQSSLFGLRAVISREKEKMLEGKMGNRKIFEISKQPKKNIGVQERAKKDQTQKIGAKLHDGSKMLQIKQKMYDSLESSKRNVGKLLVDFSAKILQDDENNDYEKVRQQFYSGKLKEIQQQREQIQVDNIGCQDLHERLAWERQVMGKLKGQQDEREKVMQVFDRKMHGDQKNALQTVLKEFQEEEKKLEQAKQRREQFQNQRIRKLQKLNILSNETSEKNTKDNNQISKAQDQ